MAKNKSGVLYPGQGSGSSMPSIQARVDWKSNAFDIPYEWYKRAEFLSKIDDDGTVRLPDYNADLNSTGARWDDGTTVTSDSIVNKLHRAINIPLDGNPMTTFKQQTRLYNRFKISQANDIFQKGFPHVFFVRPDLNLLAEDGKSLRSQIDADANFRYAFRNSPDLIYQLTSNSPGMDHDWMLYLSNKAESFSLSDEYIDTGTYGKTYTGWAVSYGKHDINSKTVGDFSIKYTDDRNLHIYNLHKLWIKYIANCYRGIFTPTKENIFNRIRDYATAVYYIVTAEDGETIIFWSKYYGVFPSTIPSTQLSWSTGQFLTKPEFDIKYNFSFKEDFNPLTLIEFNSNTKLTATMPYTEVFDPNLGHVGSTWVGAPFIELIDERVNDQYGEHPYTFKLRFKSTDEYYQRQRVGSAVTGTRSIDMDGNGVTPIGNTTKWKPENNNPTNFKRRSRTKIPYAKADQQKPIKHRPTKNNRYWSETMQG